MEQKYFLFRKEWCDAASGLLPRIRLEIYEGIIRHALYGEDFKPMGKIAGLAFINADKVIDLDCEELTKRDNWLAMCREAGKRGGRPKKGNGKPTVKGGLKEGFSAQNTENPPENPDPSSRAHGNSNQELIIDDKIKKEKIEKEAYKKETEKLCQTFIDSFNTRLEDAKALIPHNVHLTDKRRVAILARVREYGKNALDVLIGKAAASHFLNGGGSHQFVASIDWLLRPNNFPKVLEGNYDNNKTTGSYENNRRNALDLRRGFEPRSHTAEEYAEEF